MDCGMVWLVLMCVQIVTEVFPISSSGHQWLLGKRFEVQLPDTLDHLANGICSVLVALYFTRRAWCSLKTVNNRVVFMRNAVAWGMVADSVTLIFYIIRAYGLVPVPDRSIGFAITAALLLYIPYRGTRTMLTYSDALLIGCAQGIALTIGCSRLATTMWCAATLGIGIEAAWYWSWWLYCGLSVPAAAVAGVHWLQRGDCTMVSLQITIALICAAALALLGMRCMEYCVTQRKLWIFSWYLVLPFMVALVYAR